jgi:hypothetical protein
MVDFGQGSSLSLPGHAVESTTKQALLSELTVRNRLAFGAAEEASPCCTRGAGGWGGAPIPALHMLQQPGLHRESACGRHQSISQGPEEQGAIRQHIPAERWCKGSFRGGEDLAAGQHEESAIS